LCAPRPRMQRASTEGHPVGIPDTDVDTGTGTGTEANTEADTKAHARVGAAKAISTKAPERP
jgi:hypothetical protein